MTTTNVYALLKDDRAIDLFVAAGEEVVSPNEVVRAVIDNKLGILCLATKRPSDEVEERVIKVQTETPRRAGRILAATPGVVKVASSFAGALTQG